jgi:EmrB/QacA subfamily drug resistance transporter
MSRTATAASRTAGASAPHQTWTVVLASVGVLMTALDMRVVTTSLSVLRVSLHACRASLEWTVNACNLSFACLLLTGAALGDRFGRRRMFTIGVGVFTAASALSALSPNVGCLIAARALQGAGAAIVMPLTLALISEAFPTEKRGVAIGLWGGMQGLAVAAGPLVGGAIAGGINWHWIFWLNVPIGLALMPMAAKRLSESFGPRPQLDLVRLVLAALAGLGITWALVRAQAVGWGSPQIIGSMATGLVLAGVFLEWERRSATPMLQRNFFRNRTFASANGVSFFMYAGLFGTLFLMARVFQVALGDSPLGAGLRLLPWTGAPIIVAPIAGALSERYGNRPFMAAGLALQTIGVAWVALIAAPGNGVSRAWPRVGCRRGRHLHVLPDRRNAVMGSVPLQEAGVAAGANSMLRELGGVLGIAVLASVFVRQGVYHWPRIFNDGFTRALWVGVGFSAIGCAAALAAPRRKVLLGVVPAVPVAIHEAAAEPAS